MKIFTRIEPTTIHTVGDRFKRDVVVKRFRTEDGLEHEFTTFYPEHQQGAAVIGLTSDCQVVVVRQFRPGRASYCYEIPGGGLEDADDENIEAVARREFFEETGYKPGGVEYLGVYSGDAYTNHSSHYFLATDCYFAGEPPRDQTEIDQGVETVLISIDQLIENAKTNQMTDAVAVLMAYDTLKELQGGES